MHRVVAIVTASVLLAGCEPPVVGDPLAELTVYGQLSRPDGVAPSDVSVVVEAREGSCANPKIALDSVASDSSGRYRAWLSVFGTQYTVCVNVRVAPPAAVGLASDSVQRAPVEMRSRNPDSLRVDILLRPTA